MGGVGGDEWSGDSEAICAVIGLSGQQVSPRIDDGGVEERECFGALTFPVTS